MKLIKYQERISRIDTKGVCSPCKMLHTVVLMDPIIRATLPLLIHCSNKIYYFIKDLHIYEYICEYHVYKYVNEHYIYIHTQICNSRGFFSELKK